MRKSEDIQHLKSFQELMRSENDLELTVPLLNDKHVTPDDDQ